MWASYGASSHCLKIKIDNLEELRSSAQEIGDEAKEIKK